MRHTPLFLALSDLEEHKGAEQDIKELHKSGTAGNKNRQSGRGGRREDKKEMYVLVVLTVCVFSEGNGRSSFCSNDNLVTASQHLLSCHGEAAARAL